MAVAAEKQMVDELSAAPKKKPHANSSTRLCDPATMMASSDRAHRTLSRQ